MAENEGNNPTEGGNGSESQEGGGNNNPTVDEITADALKLQLAEKDEMIKTMNAKTAALKEEAKNRRLDNDKYKALIEANSKQKADASVDVDEVKREMEGIFTNQKAEIASLTDQIRDFNVNAAISSAANAAGAIKPSQVAQLIKPYIGYDDNNTPYIRQNGSDQPARDKDTGLPMTVAVFTKNFLIDNKHLLAASGNAGAGSAKGQGAAQGGVVFTQEQIIDMTVDEYKKNQAVIHKQYSAAK